MHLLIAALSTLPVQNLYKTAIVNKMMYYMLVLS